MELRHLRYFIAVAEALHFGRAAGKLRIAQPSLSQQICVLEEELGVRLLERTNRSVALTHAGSVFLVEARVVLAQADRATVRATQAHRGKVGHLNVGYVLSAAGAVLTRALREFKRAHPEVELVLHDLPEAQQRKQLLDQQIDVALTRTAFEHEGVAGRIIERNRLMVWLPIKHRLAKQKAVPLRALADEQFIIGRDAEFPSYNQTLRTLCRHAGFELRVRQQVRDLPSILWMVSAGMGCGFVQSGLDGLERADVVKRPLLPSTESCVWMHWREDDASPVLKHFLAATKLKIFAD
jgi:DNA-binding transcriptional LysR family regulator